MFNLEVVCGGAAGCEKVLTSPYATFGPVPVAVIGLFGYLILAGLALARILGPGANRPKLTQAGLAFSSLGLLASAYFIYVSIDIIGDTCKWCLSSAVIMLLSFLSHLFLTQKEDEAPRPRRGELPALVVCALVVLAVIPVRIIDMKNAKIESSDVVNKQLMPATIAELVPANAHMIGDANAPVTIIEFGDLTCPHCKESYHIFTKILKQSGSQNVRFIFRHFPLVNTPGHQWAAIAAMISEIAGESNHFWTFVDEMYSVDDASQLSMGDMRDLAEKAGVPIQTLNQRCQDTNDPIYKAVVADMKQGGDIGVHSTPTIIIAFKNGKPVAGNYKEIEDILQLPPYNKYVKGI